MVTTGLKRSANTGSNPVLTTKPKSILHEHWLTAWKDKQHTKVAELVDATQITAERWGLIRIVILQSTNETD
jgi:hypothetical protein